MQYTSQIFANNIIYICIYNWYIKIKGYRGNHLLIIIFWKGADNDERTKDRESHRKRNT